MNSPVLLLLIGAAVMTQNLAAGGLFDDVPSLSPAARSSLVAHYDGRMGVVTGFSNSVSNITSWTPVDGTGAALVSMVVTQAGGGPDLVMYDGAGTLSFSSASASSTRHLRGQLAAAAGSAYTIFWKGHHKAPATGQDAGNYVYNIGGELNHQRDVNSGIPAIELYDGSSTFRGTDISAYDNNITVWSTVYNANAHAAYANGFNLGVPGTPNYNVPANPGVFIGAFDATGFDFHGELSHLIIFNSALSAADRVLIENYLVLAAGRPDMRLAPLTSGFEVTNSAPAEIATIPTAEIALSAEEKLLKAAPVWERLEKGEERVHVMVNLSASPGRPRGREWNSRTRLGAWQRMVRSRQEEVLGTLLAADFEVRRRFENQNGFSGFVTRRGLEKLAQHPHVVSVEPVGQVRPHLAQGIPLMNAATYRSNYSGAGMAVAIVDTGIDYNHPRLGGGAFPNAKVVGGYDFANDDSDPYDNVFAHGTACAGIAAGSRDTVGNYIGGVVPDAKIYALKVVTPDGFATDDDIAAAWDWCVTHKNDNPANPLLVISTSLGLGRHARHCDTEKKALATAAANAVDAGITLVVSSGNDGWCDSVDSPACLSSVISVGGVFDSAQGNVVTCVSANSCGIKSRNSSCFSGYSATEPTQADKVVNYSNTSTFLDLLAPAYLTHTTDLVGAPGYSSGDYAPSFNGTSAACPYAAGAVAALQLAARDKLGRWLTPAEVRLRFVTTGDPVTDTKVAITKPRINLGRAIEMLGANPPFTIFNDGDAALNITLLAFDAPAPWFSWMPEAPITIPPGGARSMALTIDPAQVPPGVTTRQLIVTSNDGDDGIFLTTTNLAGPLLRAMRGPQTIVISWLTNASGYELQSSDTLSADDWNTASLAPTIVEDRYFVTNSLSGQHRFYRLRR